MKIRVLPFVLILAGNLAAVSSWSQGFQLLDSYTGHLAPKSIVHNGKGLFFAQNMMYEHTISVYKRNKGLVATLSDSIKLSDFGFSRFKEKVRGAPCEAAVSHGGKFIWIANYAMYGQGFDSIAGDECIPNGSYDSSFVFKISPKDFKIINAIKVGCVPKFLQVYRDSLLLVSNWCSGNVSVVSMQSEQVIRTYKMKKYPRGIAFSQQKNMAYIAQMGTYEIAKVHLNTHKTDSIKVPGRSPRHLCLDEKRQLLYASINGSGVIAKIDLANDSTLAVVATGRAPRSMILTKDGQYLYVVNYYSNTFTKVRTSDFKVLESKRTNPKPIGITFDNRLKNVWVSCYSGSVQVFKDIFYGKDSMYQQAMAAKYGLVLGSFENEENANKYLGKVKEEQGNAIILIDGEKHRVVVCGFETMAAALLEKENNPVFSESWVLKCEED